MNDPPRITVPSPCRDICRLDNANICIGCGRSVSEIQEWPRADSGRRLLIRATARARIEQYLETAQRTELLNRRPL